MPQPTEGDIYRDLRRLADEHGRTSNSAYIDEHSALTVDFVHLMCGGVPQAQVAAGSRQTSANGLGPTALTD